MLLNKFNFAIFPLVLGITFQVGQPFGSRIGFVIVCVLASFSLLILIRDINKKITKNEFLLILFAFANISIYLFNSVEFIGFSRSLLAYLTFFVTYFLFRSLTIERREKIFTWILVLALLFSILELTSRLQGLSDLVYLLNSNLHSLKSQSAYYSDSNGYGIYILCIIMLLILYILNNELKRRRFFVLGVTILCLFLMLSLSRSAIISFFFFLFFIFSCHTKSKLVKYIHFLIMVAAILLLIPKLYEFVLSDSSGSTRILIFQHTFSEFGSDTISEMFFGLGEGLGKIRFSYEEGAYAHALIPLLLGMSGLIGTATYFMFWVILILSERMLFLFLGPLFITGLILLPPYFEVIYFCLGALLAQKNKEPINNN
ncbi:hypothetical protein [Vibrio sp. A2-1]|uniref:hypothetical protein n=1 Tax=Vibrio sp. A2-1 TaxID=2912252 RepID=UPI001F3E83B7|nr:hypothetical protein [Vibrio sp. A2-1]